MTRAGFGRGVITPPLPVALAGFSGRAGPAEEVHTDLEARATILESNGVTVCLLVCDLLGMSVEFAGPVRAAVADALGIDPSAVLTSCVHTHAGPSCITGAEQLGWPTPEGYLEILVAGCLAAVRDARNNTEPAELRLATAALPRGVSVNRRGNPYRPRFTLLDARTPRGERLGAVANVSIHPVALGRECLAVSSDWVGYFRDEIERRAGGRSVLLSGALGDVNPHLHDEEGSFEDAQAVGVGVADAVEAALMTSEPIGDGIQVLPVRTFEAPATGLLAQLGGIESIAVELLEWQVGSARIVSVPGEAFHALGRAIEVARGDRVLLAGLAPVWQGYLPEPFADGYEETLSYGAETVAAIKHALLAVP